MAYKVTYTHDDFPKDHEFEIRGLGLFINGKAKEIDEEQEIVFISETRKTIKDAFDGDENITVEGTTEVRGGVIGVLGVDPADISDTPDFEAMKVLEESTSADPVTGEELSIEEQVVITAPIVNN